MEHRRLQGSSLQCMERIKWYVLSAVMGYNLKLLIHGLIGPETPFWKTGPRVCFIATILNLEELSDAVNRACRTAYIHGLNFCSGDFVIIMDADFSHHVCCSWISVFVR